MDMIEFREAVRRGLESELKRDETVIFFGEDVAAPGGVFKVTTGLDGFGEQRVFDTPISELAIAGAAYGAAIGGLRPVIEIMFGDFMALPMDSLVNQAAKYRYLSNDTGTVPLVVRGTVGAGGRFGAVHSQIHASWFQSVNGLKIVCPATPNDAFGLLAASIRDDDPVLFLEHKLLYPLKGAVDGDGPIPDLGTARVAREGSDITLATCLRDVHNALAAAAELEAEGVSVEVIDLRSLRPVDLECLTASVNKTNRLLVVEEGSLLGGWGANLAGLVAMEALHELDDVFVLSCPDSPVPFSPRLEDAYLPGPEKIARTVRARLGLVPRL